MAKRAPAFPPAMERADLEMAARHMANGRRIVALYWRRPHGLTRNTACLASACGRTQEVDSDTVSVL